ncbi:MAG: hypothetical protein SGCHY_003599 [Lobulomycetales sp.]
MGNVDRNSTQQTTQTDSNPLAQDLAATRVFTTTNTKSPAFSIAPPIRGSSPHESPGPAAYDTESSTSPGRSTKFFSLSGRVPSDPRFVTERRRVGGKSTFEPMVINAAQPRTPAPNAYSVTNHNKQRGVTMGIRHSEFSLHVGEPGPATGRIRKAAKIISHQN